MSNNEKSYADTIGATSVSISDSHKTLLPILIAGDAPCVHGDPGIGKTVLGRSLSEMLGVKPSNFLNLVVSTLLASDIAIPMRAKDDERFFELMLSSKFRPILEAADKGEPSFILLDEITRYQDPETASYIFDLLGERRIGNFKFPDNCYIMAACNPDDGNYAVKDIITDWAWRRRLCHIIVEADVSGWLQWAKAEEINELVIDYVASHVDKLTDTAARAAGKIFSNPASWTKLANYLDKNNNLLNVSPISTYIGYDLAANFVAFTENSEFKLSLIHI